eukprot:TRINITY_DN7417_c0_g1_i1.p1 TRINITY_DN7417_c0_g1~~TRINITY_DN7417_c0_g1_i1.p1  ORF type:complete len:707 (+),score=68.23 TRINITY_DN7417_c0_g1_i1:2-2122(+)
MHTAPPIRQDIQCLRGVAVTLVVLYHFGLSWAAGGFIGVDIFFVVSGYLVVGKMLKDMVNEEFSLLSFWVRRIKRLLLPSSVCLIFILLGCIWVEPTWYWVGSFEDISMAGIHGVNFWFFYQSAGYFHRDTQSSLVLHFWSLSVEEQVYFLVPILSMAFLAIKHKVTRESLRSFALILSISSFASCFFVSQPAKFFLSPFRLWEFFAGGLTCLYQDKVQWYQVSGLIPLFLTGILVTGGTFITNSEYPNFTTLAVVMVTASILACEKPKVHRIFRPVVLVGDWSYSIYLYHWPIIKWLAPVFARSEMLHADVLHFSLFALLLGALSLLSYYFVERVGPRIHWRPMFWFLLFIVLSLGIFVSAMGAHSRIQIQTTPPIKDSDPDTGESKPKPIMGDVEAEAVSDKEPANLEPVDAGLSGYNPDPTEQKSELGPKLEDKDDELRDPRKSYEATRAEKLELVERFQKILSNSSRGLPGDAFVYKESEQPHQVIAGLNAKCVQLFGDSHAQMLYPLAEGLARETGASLFTDIRMHTYGYEHYSHVETTNTHPNLSKCRETVVIISSVTNHNIASISPESFHHTLDYWSKFNCTIVWRDTATWDPKKECPIQAHPKLCLLSTVPLEKCAIKKKDHLWNFESEHWPESINNTYLVDLNDVICPEAEYCYANHHQYPKWMDCDHLSSAYVKDILLPHFMSRVRKLSCIQHWLQ